MTIGIRSIANVENVSVKNMHTIGILGGMGSYATVELFRRIIDAFPAEKEWDRPRILIDNNCTMPSRVRAILYQENREELIREMSDGINHLVESGANRIILGCITAHCFLDCLPHRDIIVNAIDETVDAIDGNSLTVFCSEGTKDVGVWDKALPDKKIVYPNQGQMVQLREFIEVVKQGKISDGTRKAFIEFVNTFPNEEVLLGCTELPILLENQMSSKRIIDPIQCVIDKLQREFSRREEMI